MRWVGVLAEGENNWKGLRPVWEQDKTRFHKSAMSTVISRWEERKRVVCQNNSTTVDFHWNFVSTDKTFRSFLALGCHLHCWLNVNECSIVCGRGLLGSCQQWGKRSWWFREQIWETHRMPGRIVIWSANDFEEIGEKEEEEYICEKSNWVTWLKKYHERVFSSNCHKIFPLRKIPRNCWKKRRKRRR